LFEDRDGAIWIGSGAKQSGGKGLCRYNGVTLSESISPFFVMYMCEDQKGNLWLAHNKGEENINFALYRYDGETFTKIIEQDKPDNPVIFGILADKNGHIWFGTSKGVCCYDGKTFNYFLE
jgi:ligand-binding sensor domain-containing protein